MGVVFNPIPQVVYYELDGTATYSTILSSTWENWDLSALIPAGTVAVEVVCQSASGSNGARMDGSVLNRRLNTESGWTVRPSTARIIEVYAAASAPRIWYLKGYYL